MHGQGIVRNGLYNGGAVTLINNGLISADLNGQTLELATSHFTNNGIVEAVMGGALSIDDPAPTNTGAVYVDSSSNMAFNNGYTQTAGSTKVNGKQSLNNGSGTLNLLGGSLSGLGVINGNVNNASHVHPGDAPGLLTLNGNYTQTILGNFDVDLGGSPASGQYGHLKVSGNVILDGTLNVGAVNNFVPVNGDVYDILDYGTLSGNFATLNTVNGHFSYVLLNNVNLKELQIHIAPVPGPDSLIVLGLGMAGVVVRLRRRGRTRAAVEA